METLPNTKQAYQLFHEGCLALTRAEQHGFRIDTEYCTTTRIELSHKIKMLEEQLEQTQFYKDWKRSRKNSPPNINSGKQLGNYLYGVIKLTCPTKTKAGGNAVDEEVLKQFNLPELDTIIQIRKLKKIRDTYLGAFTREQVNGVLHPFFNLHLAVTFRSSSDRPNFQNIPKRDKEAMQICRRAIYPRKGHQLMEVDYKGIEVAIAACYHKDPVMIHYIENPASDMHLDMASQIFKLKNADKKNPEIAYLRSATKNGFVFPQFYGDYYKGCAVSLMKWGQLPESRWNGKQGVLLNGKTLSQHLIDHNIKSASAFIEHIREIEDDFWNTRFKIYNRWKIRHWKTYQKNGFIDLKTGFRCQGVMKENDIINYPIQGSAFHCLLWSFIEMDKEIIQRKLQTRLVGQIHDAIILDVAPGELEEISILLQRVMCQKLREHWKWINVPLSIDADLAGVDESWADVKGFKLPEPK